MSQTKRDWSSWILEKIVPVLIQTVVVLSVVSVVMLDYVDARINSSQTQSIKIVTLSELAVELNEKGLSPEQMGLYAEKMLQKFIANGYIVIDGGAVLAAPKDMYLQVPSKEALEAIVGD